MLRRFGSSGFNATQRAPPSPAPRPRAPTTIGRGSNPTDAVKTKTKKNKTSQPSVDPGLHHTASAARRPPPCRGAERRRRSQHAVEPAAGSARRPPPCRAVPRSRAPSALPCGPQSRPPPPLAARLRSGRQRSTRRRAAQRQAPTHQTLKSWPRRRRPGDGATSPDPLRLLPPPHARPCSTPPRDRTGADRRGAELIVSNSAASWRFGG